MTPIVHTPDGRPIHAEEVLALEIEPDGTLYVRRLDGSTEKIERDPPPTPAGMPRPADC